MTPDEKRMLEYLQKGKEYAINSPALQLLFRGIGKFYSDPTIRNIIRTLIYKHGISIIGDPGCGFYIAETAKEIEAYDANLYSRAVKIMRRRKIVHNNFWNGRQIDIFT